jgi:hypothetical protein
MPSRPNSSDNDEGLADKMKRMTGNCLQSTGLCCFKLSENTQITVLENKIAARQKQFGIDYLTLAQGEAPESKLRQVVKDALDDIEQLNEEIYERRDKIDDKTNAVQEKIKTKPGQAAAAMASAPTPSNRNSWNGTNNNKKTNKKKKTNKNSTAMTNSSNKSSKKNPPKKMTPTYATTTGGKNAAAKKKTSPKFAAANGGKNSSKKKTPIYGGGAAAAAAAGKNRKDADNGDDVPEEYKDADPSKWKCREYQFSGQSKYETKGYEEKMKGSNLSLAKGLQTFQSNPAKYTAIAYQADMPGWSVKDQQYLMLHRKDTVGWKPQGVSPKGWMTVHVNEYERLVPFKDDVLPKKFRDKYTDSMTFQGKKLHSAKNKPIMPGRGMGSGDTPSLKIIGDVDPSDIFQGSVGDCWLLSGISSVAEFDGAIKRLFRKTKNLYKMPWDGRDGSTMATGNTYTVTLWDLTTWKEVDIVIDERLPAHYNGSGNLLAGKPSEDGELWACYLEKALAVHCGGWDKIVGGQCTHAWALLTGCKEQYTMGRNPVTGKWRCFANFNPKTKEWADHTNSPHDCCKTTWKVGWPDVGGGGSRDVELDDEEMFLRLFAWDQVNYIVGAGTSGASDKQSTGGMVDNHAYSVIESVDNVAGTDIDLIKVRNPWGSGEIEDGEFDDDGPGWDKYPQIKKALNPVVADDGIFWVTKKEFFQFFSTIYLSASNMTEFLED